MSDFSQTPGWHGGIEIRTNGCLIAFSTLFLGMRLYVRAFMTKAVGWDDLIACIAWGFLVTQSSLDIRNVSFGSGTHLKLVPPELLPKFFELLSVQKCVYFWAVAFVRWSILAFLPRLSSDKIVTWSIYGIGSLIMAQTITCFAYLLTSCTPIEDNFKPPFFPGLKCRPATADRAMMEGHAAAGIAVDILLLVLPIYIIYTKMMWSKRTVQVILVMSIGIFVIVVGIVRLVLIKTLDFYTDTTYKMNTIGIWTNLEGHIGFWCCCFPALQPIIRGLSYKLGLRSNVVSYGNPDQKYYGGRSGTGGVGKGAPRSGTHGGANGSRSQTTVTTKNGYVKNGSGVDNSSDSDSVRAIVISAKAMEGNRFANSMEMNALDMGGKGGTIHKRTEVSIQTEQLDSRSKPMRGGPGVANSWVDMD